MKRIGLGWVAILVAGTAMFGWCAGYVAGAVHTETAIEETCINDNEWTELNGRLYYCMSKEVAVVIDKALTHAYPNWPNVGAALSQGGT